MPKRVIMAPGPDALEQAAEAELGPLPPELMRDVAHRLGFAAIVTLAGATSFLFYTELIMAPSGVSSALRLALFPLLLTLSVAILVLARSEVLATHHLLDVGLMYEVLVAACAGLLVNQYPWPDGAALPGWSPVAVWVIVFPLLVPAPAWRTFFASLVAAAMDPLALLLLTSGEAISPPPAEAVVVRLLPNAAAVLIAVAITRLLHGLHHRASTERTVGAYRLVERLGSGGVGEVWRAEHRLLDRPAAIKLIRPALFDDRHTTRREVIRRFEREVQATANLRSPHTVRIYDFGVSHDGDFFYVMELLDGLDLYTLVERFGPMPPERVVHLMRQACSSLHEAHQQGLVHRDIKPGNLLTCRYGDRLDFMKVLDFGFVKQRETDPSLTQLTQHGIALGTPAFMAPEVAYGRADLDGRADLYALGCVAWWCLTGRTPFEGSSTMAIMMKHTQEPPRPPSAASPGRIPEALDEIILACLAKEPTDRPSTALELAYRLADLDIEKFWTSERKILWWATHAPVRRPSSGDYLIAGHSGELVLDRR